MSQHDQDRATLFACLFAGAALALGIAASRYGEAYFPQLDAATMERGLPYNQSNEVYVATNTGPGRVRPDGVVR